MMNLIFNIHMHIAVLHRDIEKSFHLFCLCTVQYLVNIPYGTAPARQWHLQKDLLAQHTCFRDGIHQSQVPYLIVWKPCLDPALNSRQCAEMGQRNILLMDDCDPPLGRLRHPDSWMDWAKSRKENGVVGGGGLGIQGITPTFHLPSGQLQLKGITSTSFNTFFLFPA